MGSLLRVAFAIVVYFVAGVSANAGPLPSRALYFDGVNDWIEVPDSPGSALDITGSVTLEAWIRFENFATCCWNTVAAKGFSHPTENVSYWMAFSNHPGSLGENSVYGDFGQQLPAAVYSDATSIRDNTWHHIAVVLDDPADQIRLFVDGALKATGVQTAPIPVTDFSFYIGNRPGHIPATFEGYIDEVRLWNRARTESEFLDTMNRELSGQEDGLVGYWNFNEGTGEIAHDQTINANHGFFVGNPTWVTDGPMLMPVPEPPAAFMVGLGAAFLLLCYQSLGSRVSGSESDSLKPTYCLFTLTGADGSKHNSTVTPIPRRMGTIRHSERT